MCSEISHHTNRTERWRSRRRPWRWACCDRGNRTPGRSWRAIRSAPRAAGGWRWRCGSSCRSQSATAGGSGGSRASSPGWPFVQSIFVSVRFQKKIIITSPLIYFQGSTRLGWMQTPAFTLLFSFQRSTPKIVQEYEHVSVGFFHESAQFP